VEIYEKVAAKVWPLMKQMFLGFGLRDVQASLKPMTGWINDVLSFNGVQMYKESYTAPYTKLIFDFLTGANFAIIVLTCGKTLPNMS